MQLREVKAACHKQVFLCLADPGIHRRVQHAHRQHDEEEGGVLGEDHRRTESRGYGTRRPVFIELRGGRGLYVVSVDKMDLLND